MFYKLLEGSLVVSLVWGPGFEGFMVPPSTHYTMKIFMLSGESQSRAAMQ